MGVARTRSRALVAPFADRFLRDQFGQLETARRIEVVDFITRRVDGMTSLTRAGVLIIGGAYRVLMLVAGWRPARLLAATPIPLLGEYPRLVRSLAVAYIWERWPDTMPDGARA